LLSLPLSLPHADSPLQKDKINNQVRKLEQDLQSNLLQGARLIEENHRLKNLLQDSASKLKVASDGILKHLAKRGFKNDPRQGAGDADLSSSVEDLLRVIRAHVEIDEGDRDESGFSVNWDGALARIKREFDFSFTYGTSLPPSLPHCLCLSCCVLVC
jgi:hypothetical protein